MFETEGRLPEKQSGRIQYRLPRPEDGLAVSHLIRSCKPLDENSLYCNLLQCDHFASTSIAAEDVQNGALVGWISGYLIPDEPNVLFIWQVAVDGSVQGKGVAGRMLRELLARDKCRRVTALKTTITADNEASWALFSSFARRCGGNLLRQPHFEHAAHFGGKHATEHMVTIQFPGSIRDAA